MQIEKALISTERLSISKLSWKFRIPTIYNFAEIYPWSLLFSEKVAYFLTVLPVLFVLKWSYIFHYTICITVPLTVAIFLIYKVRD